MRLFPVYRIKFCTKMQLPHNRLIINLFFEKWVFHPESRRTFIATFSKP